MQILTIDILEMVTDMEKITIDIKYLVMYGHSVGILTCDIDLI